MLEFYEFFCSLVLIARDALVLFVIDSSLFGMVRIFE